MAAMDAPALPPPSWPAVPPEPQFQQLLELRDRVAAPKNWQAEIIEGRLVTSPVR